MSIFDKKYKLSLTKNYVSAWGVVEAVRELIQNTLDSDSPFEYEIVKEEGLYSLTLRSKFASLPPRTLLLGATSKAENKEAIGNFGEGYKLALLVLTREEYPVTILNNQLCWMPSFEFDKTFEEEILVIEETKIPRAHSGLSFIVGGLTEDDVERIRLSCLLMHDVGELVSTSFGDILLDKKGQIYVGGLFVCEIEDFEFGYNIKPEYITLERDRQTVSTYDVGWVTKNMWENSRRFDQIAEMLERGVEDVRLLTYGSDVLVKEACYKAFKEKYPGKVPVNSQKELDELAKKGITNTVYVKDSTYYGSIVQSPSYKLTISEETLQTPEERLKAFFEENKKHFHRVALVHYKELLEESKKWRRI